MKILLLHLAAKSDSPEADLQAILREVLEELQNEVQEALRAKPALKLVGSSDGET